MLSNNKKHSHREGTFAYSSLTVRRDWYMRQAMYYPRHSDYIVKAKRRLTIFA